MSDNPYLTCILQADNQEVEIICVGPTAVLKTGKMVAAEAHRRRERAVITAYGHAYSFSDHCTLMCQVLWAFPAGAPPTRVQFYTRFSVKEWFVSC